MVGEGNGRRHSRACERQKVNHYPPNPMLAREIFRGSADDGLSGIPVAESLCYTVIVRDLEGVEEVREHFTAPFQMQYMQQGIRKLVWKRQGLNGPNDLRVVPSVDSAWAEIAHVREDVDKRCSILSAKLKEEFQSRQSFDIFERPPQLLRAQALRSSDKAKKAGWKMPDIPGLVFFPTARTGCRRRHGSTCSAECGHVRKGA